MEMVNNNFFDRKTLLLLILLVICAIRPVLAEAIMDIHNFDLVLSAGDKRTIMDDEIEKRAGYIKVDLNTKDGDKYDVRLKYSKTYLRTSKVFAEKKGLNAKGDSSTVYFIPKKGECPGKEEECVRVPVIEGISTSTELINSKRIFYGVEIYNGSAFGGRLKVKGSYEFINYD